VGVTLLLDRFLKRKEDKGYLMNKIQVVLAIAVVGIILCVGIMIYYEMVTTLEDHPEIKEFGGPPVMTDLRLVAIVTVVAAIFCGITLKLGGKKHEETKT